MKDGNPLVETLERNNTAAQYCWNSSSVTSRDAGLCTFYRVHSASGSPGMPGIAVVCASSKKVKHDFERE